eukprot:421624-Alexandrium_andersonii.AAC.1
MRGAALEVRARGHRVWSAPSLAAGQPSKGPAKQQKWRMRFHRQSRLNIGGPMLPPQVRQVASGLGAETQSSRAGRA